MARPSPVPPKRCAVVGLGLPELLEQLCLLLCGHADAGVGDRELDEAAAIAHLAETQQNLRLFDHLVGAREQRRRDVEPEHPCGRQVDDQLELAHLHDRQARRVRALENSTGIYADLTIHIHNVAP